MLPFRQHAGNQRGDLEYDNEDSVASQLSSRGVASMTSDNVVSGQAARSARGGTFAAATIAAAPLIPICAGLMAVVASTPTVGVLPLPEPWPLFLGQPLLAGAGFLLISWLSLGLIHLAMGFCAPERADARSYDSFSARADQLRARWVALMTTGSHNPVAAGDADERTTRLMAAREVIDGLRTMAEDRRARDSRWVLGHGYIRLWRTLNRAEEALLELAPTDLLLAEAGFDRLRIEGSNMEHADALLTVLDAAVRVLRGSGVVLRSERLGESPPDVAAHIPRSSSEARCVVRHVRHAINDFRVNRWLGLLQARNRLLASIVFTSFTVYVLLWLSIAARADSGAILAATSFYFVGATVGLFNRLYADASAGGTNSGSDYNLGATRLIGVPLLSGVAAVLGVLFTSTLVVAQVHGTDVPSVRDAFDFINHPLNLLTAAIFGLTPGLVLERLKQQTEACKDDLKSIEADTSTRPTPRLVSVAR